MKQPDANNKIKKQKTSTNIKKKVTPKKSTSIKTTNNNISPKKSKADVEQPREFSRSLGASTPDTKSSSVNGSSPTLTIRHENGKSGSGAGARTIMGMTKPVMALVGLFALGSLGAGLWGWLTIPGLYDQIEELEYQVDRLEVEVNRFEELNQQLNESIAELEGINQDLRNSLTDLQKENDRLHKLNDNLESIVGFLNETSVVIGETLDDVTEYLAEQIAVNRVIVLETLENTYRQDMNNWDCAYRDIFRSQPFVVDENIPIGLNNLPAVLNYVQDRVSHSQICIIKTQSIR
jgi:DNA repair exonuclease SbcCD ATPase subunit